MFLCTNPICKHVSLCFSAIRPQALCSFYIVFCCSSSTTKAIPVMKHYRICVSPPPTPPRVIRIINILQSTTPFLLLSNLSSCSTLHLMLPLFIYWWSRWQSKVPAVRGWQFGGGGGELCPSFLPSFQQTRVGVCERVLTQISKCSALQQIPAN